MQIEHANDTRLFDGAGFTSDKSKSEGWGLYAPLPLGFTGPRSQRIAEGEKKRHNVRTTTENCYMPVSRTYSSVYQSCPTYHSAF